MGTDLVRAVWSNHSGRFPTISRIPEWCFVSRGSIRVEIWLSRMGMHPKMETSKANLHTDLNFYPHYGLNYRLYFDTSNPVNQANQETGSRSGRKWEAECSVALRDWYCEDVLSGRLNVRRVHEDELVLAFHHPKPVADAHVVVIPKAHVAGLMDEVALDGELLSSMMRAIQQTAISLGLLDGEGFLRACQRGGTRCYAPYALARYWDRSRCRLAEIQIRMSVLDRPQRISKLRSNRYARLRPLNLSPSNFALLDEGRAI